MVRDTYDYECICVVYINMEMKFLTSRDENETKSNIVQSIS